MSRLFERRSAWVVSGDTTRKGVVYFVKCRDCASEAEFKVTKISGTAPPEVVSKYFTNKGWLLAKSHGHDVCPECLSVTLRTRREASAEREQAKKRAMAIVAKAVPQQSLTHDAVRLLSTNLPKGLSAEDRDIALRLLTRVAELTTEQAYLQGTVVGVFDRLAELEKQVAGLLEAVTSMNSMEGVDFAGRLAAYEENENEMFRKVSHGVFGTPRLTGRVCRMAFTCKGASPQTRITISAQLCAELGIKEGSGMRAFIEEGEGEDAGLFRIVPTRERGNGSVYIATKSTGTSYIVTGLIRPTNGEKEITAQEVSCGIYDGALVLRLPDAFVTPSREKPSFAGARAALNL